MSDHPMIIDESYQTTDVGDAEQSVRRIYSRAELRESQTGPFRYEQFTRGEGGVNFTRFKINSRMDIAVDFENVAAFGLLVSGRYALQSNNDHVDSSQPFLLTPGRGSSRSEELDVLIVNVDTDHLARAAARRLGVENAQLSFGAHETVSPVMRAHWMRTVNYAWNSVIQVNDVFQNEAIRAATLETVVTAALAAFPIGVAEAARSFDFASSAAVRRAKSFIENSADQPLTVAQIADAARISVRALQLGFQRELATTPMGHLRDVRLDAARAELQAADDDTRVADVARRWAFANLGRFAAQYRTRFGENPGDTLRR